MASYPVPLTPHAVIAQWAGGRNPGVIFDFNGTLSDDEPILFRIFTELFGAHLDWPMTEADYNRHLLGHSDREIIEKAVEMTGSDGVDVEALLGLRKQRYRELVADDNPIRTEAVALVRLLADHKVPLGIVTGAQRDDVDAVLGSSPVGPLIEVVVAEEDVSRGKPDPEGFLAGAAQLGCDPAEVVVFEDSVPGVRGALAAGMRCIAVGSQPSENLIGVAPALVERLSADLIGPAIPALRNRRR